MVDPSPPPRIVALAAERSSARARRDWPVADELKATIEAAGWRVVDSGNDFELQAAVQDDVIEDGETLYGSVASIPSLLDDPSTWPFTIVVVPGPSASPPGATLAALAKHRPVDSQVVAVIAGGTAGGGPADEIVRTVVPFGPGDALQAGLQRSTGELVVVLDTDHRPVGDFVSPMREALSDDQVAVVGIEGLGSNDLRRYHPLAPGGATALRSGCFAFRRTDAATRGPIEPRLQLPGSVATWWSLTLRDQGPESQPRSAIALDLPIMAAPDGRPPDDHARSARRDAYRISSLLGRHLWLAQEQPPRGRVVVDGADGDPDDDDRDQPDHASQP